MIFENKLADAFSIMIIAYVIGWGFWKLFGKVITEFFKKVDWEKK